MGRAAVPEGKVSVFLPVPRRGLLSTGRPVSPCAALHGQSTDIVDQPGIVLLAPCRSISQQRYIGAMKEHNIRSVRPHHRAVCRALSKVTDKAF